MELCELQQLAGTARSEACLELRYAEEQRLPADHKSTMCLVTGSTMAGGTPSTALRLSNSDTVGPCSDNNEVEDSVWLPQKGMHGNIVTSRHTAWCLASGHQLAAGQWQACGIQSPKAQLALPQGSSHQ